MTKNSLEYMKKYYIEHKDKLNSERIKKSKQRDLTPYYCACNPNFPIKYSSRFAHIKSAKHLKHFACPTP
jgi:hypothetical protein